MPNSFFFYEFIFDEMIPGAKAYKVQLGGDRLTGVWNVQKLLQRLGTTILTYVACQSMWCNTIMLKDDLFSMYLLDPGGGL